MGILTAVASAVLILEFAMAGIANLAGLAAAVARFRDLTGRTLGRAEMLAIGALDVAGLAGVIAGFWWAPAGVAGAALLGAFAAFVLVLQYRTGARTVRELFAYGLFLACAVVVVIGRALG